MNTYIFYDSRRELTLFKSDKNEELIYGFIFGLFGVTFSVTTLIYFVLYSFFRRFNFDKTCNNINSPILDEPERFEEAETCNLVYPKQEVLNCERQMAYGFFPPAPPPPPPLNAAKKSSADDLSSDYLSNPSHLRRGYVAPVNSARVSEADYSVLNFNKLPKTSSPALTNIAPMSDIGISPLAFKNAENNKNLSLDSVNPLNYTDSPTIKVGEPCRLFSFNQAGLPAQYSSSLPRSSGGKRNHKAKHRSNTAIDQDEDARSGITGFSERSGKSTGKKRHKKPNRRRSRNQAAATSNGDNAQVNKEPVLENVPENLHSSQSELNKRETSV